MASEQRRRSKTKRYKVWLFFRKIRVNLADWYRPARLRLLAGMGRPVPNTTLDIHKGEINLQIEFRIGQPPGGSIDTK